MGHESRIEPWLPSTTVLLVNFRAGCLRREQTMKTAARGDRTPWSQLGEHSIGRAGGTSLRWAGSKQNSSSAGVFFLDFPVYRTYVSGRSHYFSTSYRKLNQD